jgi:hypothetical protein
MYNFPDDFQDAFHKTSIFTTSNTIMYRLGNLLLIMLSCTTSRMYGWGTKGHEIVAELARDHVSQSVRDPVDKYLQGISWHDAALWMDEIKGDKQYAYMKPWHYIKVPKDATYVESANDTQVDNLIEALNKSINALSNYSKLPRNEVFLHLKILFHLVGDLHQPLHTGYGHDKGGNAIQLQYNGRGTNLHRLWDSDIIEARNITASSCLNLKLAKRVMDSEPVDVMHWYNGSRSRLKDVYDYKDRLILENYAKNAEGIIKEQLLKAGRRLANVLNSVFNTR